jgi:hypothetical protein
MPESGVHSRSREHKDGNVNHQLIEKSLYLLESRRIAANVVLGALITVLASLLFRGALQAVLELGQYGQLIVVVALLVVAYSLASLVLSGAIAVVERYRASRKQQRERTLKANEAVAAKARKESHLLTVLPNLHKSQLDLLTKFEIVERRIPHNPTLPLVPGNETVFDLVRLGFLQGITQLDNSRWLFRLSDVAKSVVPHWLEDMRSRLRTEALAKATSDQRALLAVFATPEPRTSEEPAHPWIEYAAYESIRDLESAYVLVPPTENHDAGSIILSPDAVTLIEQMLGQKILRQSVRLDLSQVAASGSSGSGARGSDVLLPGQVSSESR